MLLFIEDDIFYLEILIRDFLEAGYLVITASDPNEAFAAVEEFGSQIQCIILDIMMRPGTVFSLIATHHGFHTGMNLYTSIRDRLPDTRVIVWTNLRDNEREHQSVRRFFSSQEECEYYRKSELSYSDLFEHIRANFPPTSKSKGQWFKMEDRVRQNTSAESPLAPQQVISPSDIYKALTQHFDEEELRTLCFELQEPELDYEGLPAEGKSGKARELVEFFRRRDKLPVLITEVRRLRSSVFQYDRAE